MRRVSMRIGPAVVAASIVSTLVFAGFATAKTPSTTACGEVAQTVSLPKAPAGLVATQSWTVGADCKVHLGPIEFVDPSTLEPVAGSSEAAISTAGETSDPGGLTALSTSTAYGVSRSWDCCGILMNEYWLERPPGLQLPGCVRPNGHALLQHLRQLARGKARLDLRPVHATGRLAHSFVGWHTQQWCNPGNYP